METAVGIHSGWRVGSCIPRRSKIFKFSTLVGCPAGQDGLLRGLFLSGWQRIAHFCTRQRRSQRFSCCIAQRMALDCSFIRSSKAFAMVCTRYCTVGRVEIVRSCTCQRLSQRFSRRIAEQMAAYCSFLHSSTAFTTVFVPYC